MERLILCRFGEIGLKGQNQSFFIEHLTAAMRKQAPAGLKVRPVHGRIFVEPVSGQQLDDGRLQEAVERLSRVFGLVAVAPAQRVRARRAVLERAAVETAKRWLRQHQGLRQPTFKVEARRADKSFPLNSLELNRVLGAAVLSQCDRLAVDVHEPDLTIHVEIREAGYVYGEEVSAPGGLPLGSSGQVISLLSGGIDSPVATWLAMKRGMICHPLYFHSSPFTSERAKKKVIDLCRVLSRYAGEMTLRIVNFTPAQESIGQTIPDAYTTLIMRRLMVRMADLVADDLGALALLTGESVGQVASQTLESLSRTQEVARRPVLRPLVTYDKNEIIDQARTIGTYDISIRPYEDCCGLFVPEHPKTKPQAEATAKVESRLEPGVDEMVAEAVETVETIEFDLGETLSPVS